MLILSQTKILRMWNFFILSQVLLSNFDFPISSVSTIFTIFTPHEITQRKLWDPQVTTGPNILDKQKKKKKISNIVRIYAQILHSEPCLNLLQWENLGASPKLIIGKCIVLQFALSDGWMPSNCDVWFA